MKRYVGLIILITCFSLRNRTWGATWYVHPDSTLSTIQAGVDFSTDGDTVLVAAGTYTDDGNRDIDFGGKAIAVVSEYGPEATVIDCGGTASDPHRAFYFHSGEDLSSILQGFTIKNGNVGVGNGGGIDCTLESSPTIADCVFLDNHADALGGGIACRGLSNPAILRCTFENNTALGYYQGAQGGGVSCFVLSNATITDCIFINNQSQFGGALDCSGSFPIVTNCLFVSNSASLIGGAVFCSSADPQITNCTFTQNYSTVAGGALVLAGAYLPSYPVLTNCILWNDSPNEVEVGIGEPTITYSDVQGGWIGAGNIDHDPLFVTGPYGDYYLSQTAAGQSQQSACVDSGNPAYPIPNGTTRTDEVPDAAPVDMGYHYPASTGILEHNSILQQNQLFFRIHPNPFAHTTNIRYMIHDSRYMIENPELRVYDAEGRLIRSFNLESPTPGRGSTISWDGTDQTGRPQGSGVYFARLRIGDYVATKKISLIR